VVPGITCEYFESREEESFYEFVASLSLRKLFMQVRGQSFFCTFINFFLCDDTFLMNLNYITEQ